MPADITIIVPAYNASEFIAATVDSALAQESVDVAVVVVDDGSTDSTVEVVAGIAARDRRVTLLQQENAGPATARNSGLAHATTELVGFLDADDLLEPGWAAAVCAELRGGAAVAVADAYFFNGVDREPQTYYAECEFAPTDQAAQMLQRNFVLSTAAALRSVVLATGGFPEGDAYRGVEDYGLWVRIALGGGRIALVPSVLSGYRRGHQSLSSNAARMKARQRKLLELIEPLTRGNEELVRAWHRGMTLIRLSELLIGLPAEAERSPRRAAWQTAHVARITRRRVHVKAATLLLVAPGAGRRYLGRIL